MSKRIKNRNPKDRFYIQYVLGGGTEIISTRDQKTVLCKCDNELLAEYVCKAMNQYKPVRVFSDKLNAEQKRLIEFNEVNSEDTRGR